MSCRIVIILSLYLGKGVWGNYNTAIIITPVSSSPMIEFGITELQTSFISLDWRVSIVDTTVSELECIPTNKNNRSCWHILLTTQEKRIPPANRALHAQGYNINQSSLAVVKVVGGQGVGLMYGILRLSEYVRHQHGNLGDINLTVRAPYISRRGIKLNVPLDARTPSYGDMGDSAQFNIPTMWDISFWHAYLDQLARDQYNLLTLWSDNPWPSLLKYSNVSGYADLSLTDVQKVSGISTHDLFKSHNNQDKQVDKEILDHSKVIKVISPADKVKFWQKVFQYAADRGMDVFIFTWNIWVWPILDSHPKHGIDSKLHNTKTIAWINHSIHLALETYPQLKGIGMDPGEHMASEKGKFSKANWTWAAYGEAVDSQNGTVEFIFRNNEAGKLNAYLEAFKPLIDKGVFSFGYKYSHARMYSSPAPDFASKSFIPMLSNHNMTTYWNIRNDDLFNFLWGDPEYTRQYILNIPLSVTKGFYMGSDGYVWGRTYATTNKTQLEVDKHWFNFMLWGRLSFDPSLDRSFWKETLVTRFPEVKGRGHILLDAFSNVSAIIPQLNRFHWTINDYMFLPEGCSNRTDNRYFLTVLDFISHKTMDGQGLVTIPDYVKAVLAGKPVKGVTPEEVGSNLAKAASNAASNVALLRSGGNIGSTLDNVLKNIHTQSILGTYYSHKVLAAMELQFYIKTKNKGNQTSAVSHLNTALIHWVAFAGNASALYQDPQVMSRVGFLDWSLGKNDAAHDIEIAKKL